MLNKIGRNAWAVLKSMKKGEHCVCEVKDAEFREKEEPERLKEFLCQLANEDIRFATWVIEARLEQLYKLDDIYGDGTLVKKQIYRGRSTAKPDKV